MYFSEIGDLVVCVYTSHETFEVNRVLGGTTAAPKWTVPFRVERILAQGKQLALRNIWKPKSKLRIESISRVTKLPREVAKPELDHWKCELLAETPIIFKEDEGTAKFKIRRRLQEMAAPPLTPILTTFETLDNWNGGIEAVTNMPESPTKRLKTIRKPVSLRSR